MARQSTRPSLKQTLAETQRKAGRFQLIAEIINELKKVVWPSREDVIRLSILVIAVSVAAGVFLGLMDLGFNTLLERLFLLGR